MKKIIVIIAAALVSLAATAQDKPKYGIQETGFFSKPKLGAYIITAYKYSDLNPQTFGDGFNCRLIRIYVDGSIYNDFKYRIQFQANGEKPHVKDFYVECPRTEDGRYGRPPRRGQHGRP